jgi:hypothetical protein
VTVFEFRRPVFGDLHRAEFAHHRPLVGFQPWSTALRTLADFCALALLVDFPTVLPVLLLTIAYFAPDLRTLYGIR